MIIISITHSKGGTGKSTLAYQLVGMLNKLKKNYLAIDCDTDNRTISTINEYIRKETPLNIKLATSSMMLQQQLDDAYKNHIEIVIIDTGGNSNEITRTALKQADKIITPISHDSVTEAVGFTRFKSVLNMVNNPKVFVSFTNINTRTTNFMNITNILKTYNNLEIMKYGLKTRNIYKRSIAQGLSVYELPKTKNKAINEQLRKAKAELKNFYNEMIIQE